MTATRHEQLAALGAVPGRATRALVDLDVIAGNVRSLMTAIGPETGICAVVKADGYGHGAAMVARTALAAGAGRLAVATVGEAVMLRGKGIDAPLIVLGPIDASELPQAAEVECEITVAGADLLHAARRLGESIGRQIPVHLKIDTGMHRYGCAPDEAGALAAMATGSGVRLVGVTTHFACADDPNSDLTERQTEAFAGAFNKIRETIGLTPEVHVANSAGGLLGFGQGTAFVRFGIAMYGLAPSREVPLPAGVQPALHLVSRLARVHGVDAGAGVSYGQTYRTTAAERLGLVPIGYADGYRRQLSNLAWMGVGGKSAPVRGRVCMDQTVIGDLESGVQIGQAVGILGDLANGPSIETMADWLQTISYEVVTSISPRVPRYYWAGGTIVAGLVDGILNEY